MLIAVSGEWWKFKIGSREHYEDKISLFPGLEDEEEEEKKKKRGRAKQKGKGKLLPKVTTIERHEDHGPLMVKPKSDVNQAKPKPGQWSKFILFGTPASNQQLYLIHELLKNIQRDLIDEIGRQADNISVVRTLAYHSPASDIVGFTGIIR